MTVGIVLVSHSAQLAAGVAEVAGQMAPNVTIRPAGGLEDGGIGTPFVLGAVSASIAANVGLDLRGVVGAALEARTANGPGGVRSVDELT